MEKMFLLVFWLLKRVNTSWALVGGNKDAYFLWREITWGLAQWKRTCCSSLTPSVSHTAYLWLTNQTYCVLLSQAYSRSFVSLNVAS